MTRAITYTTPSIRQQYERLVIVPRLRGAEREAIVLRLNAKQQANNARNAQRREQRAFLREQAELLQQAQVSDRIARQIEEQTQKEIQRRLRANEKRKEQRQKAKQQQDVNRDTIDTLTMTDEPWGQVYNLWKQSSAYPTIRIVGQDMDMLVTYQEKFKDWIRQFFQGGDSDTDLLLVAGNTYRIMLPSAIPAVQIRQFFADGIGHCVFGPILKKLHTNYENAGTASTKKRYAQYIQTMNKMKATYEQGIEREQEECYNGIIVKTTKLSHGVSMEEMEGIAQASGLKIVLNDTLNATIHTFNEKSNRGTLTLRNTDFNHVEENILVREDEPVDIGEDEMRRIWDEVKDTNKFHVDGDIKNNCPRKIYTIDAVYQLHDPNREAFQEMNKIAKIERCRFPASKYPAVNEFIKQGRIINSWVCPLSDEKPTGHLDMPSAYTQFKKCSFYQGFLGTIHQWRSGSFDLSFIKEHIGIYQFQVMNGPDELLTKLQLERGERYILPSPEILYFVSRGLSVQITAGVWGSRTDWEFTEDMRENVDGIKRYAKWSGMLAMERPHKSYTFHCQESLVCDLKCRYGDNNVLYWRESQLCTVKIPIQNIYTTHHVMAFITSYVRIQMMEAMSKFEVDNLVKVVMDGIYYKGETPAGLEWFKEKPLKEHGKGFGWYEPTNCPIESNPLLFPNHTLITGQGGAGKSYLVLTDDGFNRPLYIVPQHVLGQDGRSKYGCDYTTIHRLIGHTGKEKCVMFKDTFYYPAVIVVDELTQIPSHWVKKIFEEYPDSLILLLGDVSTSGQWFQCRTGTPGTFSPVWKPHDVNYYHVAGDRRSQDDELRTLKLKLRDYMTSIFIDGDGVEVYQVRDWVKKNCPTVLFAEAVAQFKEGDVWLAGTHKTNKLLLANGVVSGWYKEGGLIAKEEQPGYVQRGSFTIHATQGRTISEGKIFISIGDAFEYAMLYTAISRAVHFNQLVFVV